MTGPLKTKSARTQYAYERATAPLLRSHPDKRLVDFTTADINNELRAIPPRSRYISRSIYNQLFDWAVRIAELVDKNPMAKVPEMTAGPRRPKDIFSPEEIAILEAQIPDGPLWTLLFGTGMRRAEARHCRRSWIDLNRMRITIHGKRDKYRIVPFTPEVGAAVADLDLLERLDPDDHLWYRRRYQPGDRRRRGDPIGDTTFHTWYEQGLEAAGVGRRNGRLLNPHQTRHTYHWWLRTVKKLTLEERQALMGHDSPNTTVRQYGRVDLEEIAAKVAGP